MDYIKAYSFISSLNSSLVHNSTKAVIHDGSWVRFNEYMDELAGALEDTNFKNYKVATSEYVSYGTGVSGEEMKRKVLAAAMYLFNQYHDNIEGEDFVQPPEKTASSGQVSGPAAVVHQTQTNDQRSDVRVEVNQTLLSLTEALTRAEAKYDNPDAKENKFIRTLKKSLPFAKDTMQIILLIIETAKQFGLSPEDLHKIIK